MNCSPICMAELERCARLKKIRNVDFRPTITNVVRPVVTTCGDKLSSHSVFSDGEVESCNKQR
jgi:hypothetical protein